MWFRRRPVLPTVSGYETQETSKVRPSLPLGAALEGRHPNPQEHAPSRCGNRRPGPDATGRLVRPLPVRLCPTTRAVRIRWIECAETGAEGLQFGRIHLFLNPFEEDPLLFSNMVFQTFAERT